MADLSGSVSTTRAAAENLAFAAVLLFAGLFDNLQQLIEIGDKYNLIPLFVS